ncbi:MAG: response regulator [Gammaproteobacteria bacterium]|nr:response regulator [Gammaproteobacteria bacterium]
MSEVSPLKVATFGLASRDRLVVGRIIALSKCRARCYELVDNADPRGAHIALVEAADDAATGDFEQYALAHPATRCLQIVDTDPTRSSSPPAPAVTRRPFTATRLLGALDRLAEQMTEASPSPRQGSDAGSTAPSTPPASTHQEAAASAHQQPGEHGPSTQLQAQTSVGQVPESAAAGDEAAHQQHPSHRPRALVVDDSLAVRRQVGLALRKAGIDADFADNGETALALLQQSSYEILFLDVVMPGMDGYEVCRQLKRSRATKHIPVVMLTGKSSPFDKVKGKLSGCNTYLTKPVTLREFNKALSRCLEQPPAFESLASTA